jgi:hypothetical protein
VVVLACNPSTQDAEARELQVEGKPGLHSKNLPKKVFSSPEEAREPSQHGAGKRASTGTQYSSHQRVCLALAMEATSSAVCFLKFRPLKSQDKESLCCPEQFLVSNSSPSG